MDTAVTNVSCRVSAPVNIRYGLRNCRPNPTGTSVRSLYILAHWASADIPLLTAWRFYIDRGTFSSLQDLKKKKKSKTDRAIKFSYLLKVDFETCILPHISDMSQV